MKGRKHKYADGGKVVKDWDAPEKGGKPKKIETKNEPGGPHTPGAKKKAKKKRAKAAREI